MKKINKQAGFTLLEILLVVGIIAILAGIVILAINPTKQLGDTRNAQRRSDVLTILNAVYQFSIDHNGKLPTDDGLSSGTVVIPADNNGDTDDVCNFVDSEDYSTSFPFGFEISAGDTGPNASAEVELWESLIQDVASSTYLVSIPQDPSLDSEDDDTGYAIYQNASGRVTVCAPLAENGTEIKVTR